MFEQQQRQQQQQKQFKTLFDNDFRLSKKTSVPLSSNFRSLKALTTKNNYPV